MPAQQSTFDGWLSAGYDGIGPLYLTRLSHTGEVQAVSKYKYPHRDGQDGEDQGSEPLIVTGEMIFAASIDTRLYPKRFIEMAKRKAEPGAKVFTHPDRGSILGRFTQWDVTYNPMEVNSCRVSFTFEAFNEDQYVESADVMDKLSNLKDQAAVADAGLEKLEVSTGETTLSEDAVSFDEILSTPSSTAQSVEAMANSYRAKIDLILSQTEMLDPRNYEVYAACSSMAATIQDLAADRGGTEEQEIPYRLDRDVTALELALELYGDRRRADEIIARNPSALFIFVRGSNLRLPAK